MKKVSYGGKTRRRKKSRSGKPAAKPKGAKSSRRTRAQKTRSTKIDTLIAMLRNPKGASISDLAKATNWQPHSVRGAISGTVKKKRGLEVTRQHAGGTFLYRITE